MGHDVVTFQEGVAFDLSQIINVNSAIQTCDIFFWVHTHGWDTTGLEQVIHDLKARKVPIVGYHLDLWMGIERQKDLENDSYWKWMDYFFSVDMKMVDYLNSRPDMPKAFFLPAGVFEEECYIGEYREEYAHDVVFVGSRGYHQEWPYREKLINWLEKTYGNRFAQYGGGGKGTIRGKNLNDLYASAKVVVGDTLCKGFDYPYYLSDRIFETTGRGGFLIHPYIEGLEELFVTQHHVPDTLGYTCERAEVITYPFNDFGYLRYLIDYFLTHGEDRRFVQDRGHKRSKKDHTYTQRLTKLLKIVNKEKGNL